MAWISETVLKWKIQFFKASVIQGVIWAFWHTVLWFVDSDFMGTQMIPYVISNVVVMTGLCFIMNFFMEKYHLVKKIRMITDYHIGK